MSNDFHHWNSSCYSFLKAGMIHIHTFSPTNTVHHVHQHSIGIFSTWLRMSPSKSILVTKHTHNAIISTTHLFSRPIHVMRSLWQLLIFFTNYVRPTVLLIKKWTTNAMQYVRIFFLKGGIFREALGDLILIRPPKSPFLKKWLWLNCTMK